MIHSHETRVRVRYAETDQMGVVYHANYLVWMEIGRVEMCRALGVNYREMEANDGIYLVVAEAGCRYRAPARYDDEVTIRTTIAEAKARILRFSYEIAVMESGRLVATGETVHVFCDRNMKPVKLPEKHRAAFGIR